MVFDVKWWRRKTKTIIMKNPTNQLSHTKCEALVRRKTWKYLLQFAEKILRFLWLIIIYTQRQTMIHNQAVEKKYTCKMNVFFFLTHLSQRLKGELYRQASVVRRASSPTLFKHLLLRHHRTNWSRISYEVITTCRNESLHIWFRSRWPPIKIF